MKKTITVLKGGLERMQKTEGTVWAIADDYGLGKYMQLKVGATIGKMRVKWTLPSEIMEQIRWRISGYQTIEQQRDEQVRYYVESTRRDHDPSDANAAMLRESTRSNHYGHALGLQEALNLIKRSGHRDSCKARQECEDQVLELVRVETDKQAANARTLDMIGQSLRDA